MGIMSTIRDGLGRGYRAAVEPTSGLLTAQLPAPPFGKENNVRLFRQFLTLEGTAGGTSSMLVNGSSTNVDFFIQADPNNDRYVKTLSFVIADAGAAANEFGNLSALSNGCVLKYNDSRGTVTISDTLTTNFQFIRLCRGQPAFGDGAAAFRINNAAGASEGYIPVLDMAYVFGSPLGIRLKAGTKQRITLTVRDNVSALDAFNVNAAGFDRLPD